ncbi:MAG TPA: glycosyltransferase family 39 protein [Dongiaceae bacterium]|nr:glycosyltransferase family 39 protein [Dongiaceae bacterium]
MHERIQERMREPLVLTETESRTAPEVRLFATPRTAHREPAPITWLVPVLALGSVVLHFLSRNRYGFFRDELYYIACGNHLAFGYVDQPPLVAVIARLSSLLLGNSLAAFRVFPALAGAGLVVLTGCMTRELGGGRFAQGLASIGVLLAPIYLAFGSFLSMNAFEPLFWMGCAYILVRILTGGDTRLWLLFGAVAGFGLQNKHTTLVFGFGIVVGMMVAGNWKQFRCKWFWLGGLLAFLLFLPNLIWEAQHHWPQIEVVRNCQTLKNTPVSVLGFIGEEVLFFNPVALPIIVVGLGWLVLSRRGRRFRTIGWAFLIVITVVIALRGKSYYPVPFFSILLAAGGVGCETLLRNRNRLRRGYVAMLAISGAVMLPFGTPILPLGMLLRYQSLLPMENAVKMEHDSAGEVHQLYADMMGWEGMVATVAKVYQSLPAADQKRCAILAGNYGEAAAIDLLGAPLGLPKAISAHNNYYYWGTRQYTGEVVILFGQRAESMRAMFTSVEQAGTISDDHAVPAENRLPVYVCRKSKAPLAKVWPTLRYYE